MADQAINRRIGELIEETVREFGPRQAETKIDTIYARAREEFPVGWDASLWDEIIVAVARRVGVYMSVNTTPEAVAEARDGRRPMPHWKMLAVMVKGDPSGESVSEVRRLYKLAKGADATSQSWTGRGRPPSGYKGDTKAGGRGRSHRPE